MFASQAALCSQAGEREEETTWSASTERDYPHQGNVTLLHLSAEGPPGADPRRPRYATVTIVDAFSDKHVTGRGALLLEIQYLGGAGTGNSSLTPSSPCRAARNSRCHLIDVV
jgi:hypothetical protein